MPQATTNRVGLKLVRETTFNSPVNNARLQALRFTSADLQGNPQTKVSDEIESTRMVSDLQLVGKDAGGEMGIELSHQAHDIVIEAALAGTWVLSAERRNNAGVTNITAVAATTYTVLTGTAFKQYQIVIASGFVAAANNKTFIAGVASSAVSVVHTAGVVDASPATTARLKVAGLQGPSADITATASGLASTIIDFTTYGLAVGMWIKVGGTAVGTQFATALLNTYVRISVIAASALTLTNLPAGWTTDTGTGKTIELYFGDYVRNGVVKYSHLIEEEFGDITQFQYFQGAVVDTFGLKLDPQSIITGSVGFKAADYTPPAGARDTVLLTGSPVDVLAPTHDVMNTSSNVARIAEGGLPVTDPNYVLGMEVTVSNNVRLLEAVSILGSAAANQGRSIATGILRAYFGNGAIMAKLMSSTVTSIDFVVKDGSGQGLLVDMPRVKLSSGSIPVGGNDQDIVQEIGFQATKDATLLYQMHIQKFEGLPA